MLNSHISTCSINIIFSVTLSFKLFKNSVWFFLFVCFLIMLMLEDYFSEIKYFLARIPMVLKEALPNYAYFHLENLQKTPLELVYR